MIKIIAERPSGSYIAINYRLQTRGVVFRIEPCKGSL